MNLPRLEYPERLRGLYVYDFGEWTAVGYTAEEIAVLLESEAYRGGKVYKIHRAQPDGRMELCGVAPERFQLESGMFFYRSELGGARADFDELRAIAEQVAPPCRAYLHLARRRPGRGTPEFVTALIYPAEYEEDMGQWLSALAYQGGDYVEGGISHVSNYYADQKTVLEREQLWSHKAIPARSADEVLASVRRAVQR